MKTITFTIKGNHQDPFGNAFPKLKMTGKQHWTPKARSYVMWKTYVQSALIKELRIENPEAARLCEHNIATCGKPLILGDRHATMDITISWKNDAHGDPENIFGSIADALFINDKNLWGSFSPLNGERGGLVRCIITVSDQPSLPLQAISEKRTWKHSSKNPASPRSKLIQKKGSKHTSAN